MDYMTLKEAAQKWHITSRMVGYYCTSDRIPEAMQNRNMWLIPGDAEKPQDARQSRWRKSQTFKET